MSSMKDEPVLANDIPTKVTGFKEDRVGICCKIEAAK